MIIRFSLCLFAFAQFMWMVAECKLLGLRFPIAWTLQSATAEWNPRSLAKLFADIVLVNNPMTGDQDWLVTADNHKGGSLYAVTNYVIEKFKKPVPVTLEVSSSIWIAGGDFAQTGMGGLVFSGQLFDFEEMERVRAYLEVELGYKATIYPDPIN